MISITENLSENNQETSEMLDRKSILKEFNISESTFTRWCQNEKLSIPKIMINRRVYVKRDDLNKWINNFKQY